MMRTYNKRQPLFTAMMLAVCLMWSAHATATLTNGDFSSGFTGWQGDTDFDGPVDPNTSNPDNFDASSGSAVLTTDFDNFGNFFVSISQIFDLQSLGNPANTLTLDFDSTAVLDDPDDVWFAQLVDTSNSLNSIDLRLTGCCTTTVDITSLAGLNVELLFGLENNLGFDDSLTIDNIVIAEQIAAAPVPEPAAILLIGAGLAVMRRKFL